MNTQAETRAAWNTSFRSSTSEASKVGLKNTLSRGWSAIVGTAVLSLCVLGARPAVANDGMDGMDGMDGGSDGFMNYDGGGSIDDTFDNSLLQSYDNTDYTTDYSTDVTNVDAGGLIGDTFDNPILQQDPSPPASHRVSHVYYRQGPDSPWVEYGGYRSTSDANQAVNYFRYNGYDSFTR